MLQATDILSAARQEGQEDPYILLARLKEVTGSSDARAREILRMEGFEIDDLVDPRLAEISPRRMTGGFVKNS